jgi:hypothetical protein
MIWSGQIPSANVFVAADVGVLLGLYFGFGFSTKRVLDVGEGLEQVSAWVCLSGFHTIGLGRVGGGSRLCPR